VKIKFNEIFMIKYTSLLYIYIYMARKLIIKLRNEQFIKHFSNVYSNFFQGFNQGSNFKDFLSHWIQKSIFPFVLYNIYKSWCIAYLAGLYVIHCYTNLMHLNIRWLVLVIFWFWRLTINGCSYKSTKDILKVGTLFQSLDKFLQII